MKAVLTWRLWHVIAIGLAVGLLPVLVHAKTPLIIVAALDREVAAPLLTAFRQTHPRIAVDYREKTTLEVDYYAQQGNPPPDIVMSSAMPRQMARVNEGLAQPLHSPQAENWPDWAKWRNEVFGFTFEPIVMVYSLELAQHMVPPYTHADLYHLLSTQPELQGRVTTYSPKQSGVGYTLFQQDARYSPRFWNLVTALGASDVSFEQTTRAMLKGITQGRYWLGYNLLGSYAMLWAQSHPQVMVQVPKDYALVLMRMAFIHADARHPDAAKAFLNFLLGREGQRVLARKTPLFSILPGIMGPYTAQRLRDQVGEHLYPIPINATLLAYVDPMRREAFMIRWQREIRILEKTQAHEHKPSNAPHMP